MADPSAIVEGLSRFAGRGPCTDAERRAAAWLHDELRAAGHEAWVETHWVRPQWALSLALHATLAVIASLLAVAAPLPAVVLAGVTAVSLAIEASGRVGPLRLLMPRRATQNVLVPAREEGMTLLICARYDAPSGGLVTRDGPRRLAARLRRALGGRAPGPRAWVALATAAVAACAGARLAGADGLAVGVAQFVPTVALLVALAAAGDIAVTAVGPGAGDNASGVGVAMALHHALIRNPAASISPSLLLFGAGESGPAALRAYLRAEKLDPRATAVLELGPCGAGTPAYATRHGQLRAAAGDAPSAPLRRSSGAGAAGRLPAAWIGCLDPSGIVPRSRQGDDTHDRIDPAAQLATLDYALALVDALDAGLATATAA